MMGDMTVVESAVTRHLQHAILQLCNEHVGYEHTLQVLGVVCVTVDDRPHDIVVKLNNTLKRVDAVAGVTGDRRVGSVRTSAPTLWSRPAGGGDATSACCSSTAAGSSTSGDSQLSVPPPGRQGASTSVAVSPEATVTSRNGMRKLHGRKQSNPVKVKTVLDDDDEEDRENAGSRESRRSPAVAAQPESRSETAGECCGDETPSTARDAAVAGGEDSDDDEDQPFHGSLHTEAQTHGVSGSSAVRALLTGRAEQNDTRRSVTVGDVACRTASMSATSSPPEDVAPDPIVVAPTDCSPDSVVADELLGERQIQESALNFSTRSLGRAADGGTSPVDSSAVRVKTEIHQAELPMRSYGLDFGSSGRSCGTLDMSRSISVAAAAAAFSQYVDDPAVFQSLTSYDHQQRLALYASLVTAATASGGGPPGADDGQPPPMSMLNGLGPDAADRVPSRVDRSPATTNYVVTRGRLGDDLTTQRLPQIRRRERFGRGHSHTPYGQPPVKVKDIIMYDDSAPLHVQRGSRIEGDFMVDALHVEGRKRRRRTAEDTLTPEEIAEYMGTSTASGSGQFACRYCGEVSSELSRYFAHTLTAHGSFVCHQCGKSFTTKSSLLRHRPIHTGMRRFACSICRKSFYRKDKCKAHIKRHLGLADGSGPSLSPAGHAQSAGPSTPQLPLPVDHQLFVNNAGAVNLAV